MARSNPSHDVDVVVLGGGMAGLTAATLLARSGRRVACVEPEPFPRVRVGESLDWSSPSLLRRLGFRIEDMVSNGIGTYKRDIQVLSPDRAPLTASPPRSLGRRPFGAAMTTIHLDRERFDAALCERAIRCGVEFVWDAISAIRMEGDRVIECTIRDGHRLSSPWWIDASGASRIIGREAGIDVRYYARSRVCLWTQLRAAPARAGTTLSLDARKDELEWAWEIPLSGDRQSVGLVMPTDAFKALDRRNRRLGEVFVQELGRFPRYAGLKADVLEEVHARTYRPYVSTRVAGPNWLMVGEAAAMIDPLTSIGVTAALRTGSEAASIVEQAGGRAPPGGRALADYDRRVRCVGDTYNAAIERLIYRPQARRALGLRTAGLAYVLVGYGTNTLYSRLQPTTTVKTTALAALASGCRTWTRAWLAAAGAASHRSWTRAEKS